MGATTTLVTFEEFERLPDRLGKRELLRGELIELPPARKKHNQIAERFYLALLEAAKKGQRPGLALGAVHHEMSYRVARNPDSWLQPDVSLTHPGQAGEEYYEGAPLLAVEVVSESNTAEQMDAKVKDYLANGAREVWIAYPKTGSVWVYRKNTAVLFEDRLETGLLPAFSVALGALMQ